MNWARGTLADVLGDRVVYRNLEPADRSLGGLHDAWRAAGLSRHYVPRKTTPAYAAVLVALAQRAQRARGVSRPLARALFVGDTAMNDGTAARYVNDHLPTQGFIAAERVAEPSALRLDGILTLANRWSLLADWLGQMSARGVAFDEQTALFLDLDKTYLGARGRNDRAIDDARVRAIRRTMCEALGDRFCNDEFRALYDALNQPRYHPFTEDNQDYLAYVSLMACAGVVEPDVLWERLGSGALSTFGEYVALCEAQRKTMSPALLTAHDEVQAGLAAGDPTPFKAFRRREFLETVGAMDVLSDEAPEADVLQQEIVITAEVASLSAALAARGVLVFGTSDKPDEASTPTPEHAGLGYQPLHRTVMKVHGQHLAL